MQKSPKLYLRSTRDPLAMVMQTPDGDVYHLSAVKAGSVYYSIILAKTLVSHQGPVRVFTSEIWSTTIALCRGQVRPYIVSVANSFAALTDYDYPAELVRFYGGQLHHSYSPHPLPASTLH